ncbi:dipicolinate synthase [Turicibacter sp. TJ11]|uniref:dipicolinate synthase n=1 Tax=Turicibacter sp. TJ11 TaxID=2806443 RepID=UPI001F464A76|nr:dipicolinate synthase [Turicibacter sp. TJ11]
MILLINNDKRMNYLSEYIRDGGLDLVQYHRDSVSFDFHILKETHYFILPFGGISESGQIANTHLRLTEEVLLSLPEDCVILTPIRYPKLMELLTKVPRKCEVIFDYDEVAIYNSIPTAEGVIYNIIKNTDITIHQAEILVIGSGRTSLTIARDLKALGAYVSVTFRKKRDEARLFEMGLQPIHVDLMVEDLQHYDVIVNTVPALVLDEKALDHVNKNCYIMDVSSKPGGVDFDYAKQLGIQAELAGALPSIVAPKTAAYYLFRFVRDYIALNGKKE